MLRDQPISLVGGQRAPPREDLVGVGAERRLRHRHVSSIGRYARGVTDFSSFSSLPQADQDAIGRTLGALLTGFKTRDVDALAGVYAEDADWVNAFGTVKHSRDGILDHLRGLFKDANFNRGELVGPPEVSFRVLTPEVVLVSAHLKVEGQGLVGGGTLDRDNFSLRAMQRQPDGSWLIVSEMFQDANTETTYER
jgi:uncharacterized protein (TIGR02246 family)